MSPHRKIAIWPELAATLLTRLGALWLIVLIALLLPEDDIIFYAFMGVVFILTIPYSLWLRSKARTIKFAPLQFLIDLAMITGLVIYTGGIRSDFISLYPVIILSAGIVGNPKQATGMIFLVITMYSLMAFMYSHDIFGENVHRSAPLDTEESTATMVWQGLILALFGGTSIFIASRCESSKALDRQLAETTRTLLDNIPAPSLLLSETGDILSANERACFALNTLCEELRRQSFSELRQEPGQNIPESFGHSATLLREQANPIPVSYRTQDFHIYESALSGSRKTANESIKVTLLVFNDISEELNVRRQLEKVERITDATRIAGEMAHEIQGPLASLSASLQLLQHYESKATAADWLPNSPRRKDRMELFEHIEDASSRIDTAIKNFVNFAEFSPQDLLSIIKLDSNDQKQGYIGYLNTIGRDHKDGQNSHSG